MTLSEYLAVPENYRGVWTTELWGVERSGFSVSDENVA